MSKCARCQSSFFPNPKSFRPQIYCGKQCAREAYLLRRNPNHQFRRDITATNCKLCEAPFTPKPNVSRRQIYCSTKCAVAVGSIRRREERRALLRQKTCLVCNRTFMPRVKAQKLCDEICRVNWNRSLSFEHARRHRIPASKRELRQCAWCGDDFMPYLQVTQHCGKQCRSEDIKYLKEENGE